ncbi:unnamed protein product [Protopolystoma xenopodis]|uniref:Uncharacterized protein n=1 Tax=Protopolystoma xenopodis TaxID=117903 RepID=A0A3S5CJY7_9PLAT|nr:unnamed protein product [Protopolystoma xenopodis]
MLANPRQSVLLHRAMENIRKRGLVSLLNSGLASNSSPLEHAGSSSEEADANAIFGDEEVEEEQDEEEAEQPDRSYTSEASDDARWLLCMDTVAMSGKLLALWLVTSKPHISALSYCTSQTFSLTAMHLEQCIITNTC